MKRLVYLLVAFVLVLAATRLSSADTGTVVASYDVIFTSVDGFTIVDDNSVRIEGLVQGEPRAREVQLTLSAVYPSTGTQVQACHDAALQVLSAPSRYKLSFIYQGGYVYNCKIQRR
jgi:hypothetical protein